MSLTINQDRICEPLYYHREYSNDIKEKPNEHPPLCQRVTLVALPFLSLYKPLGFSISLGMGTLRTITCASKLFNDIQSNNSSQTSYQLLQTTIAIIALLGTIFAHPAGMILTTGQDLLIELNSLIDHLQKQEYTEALQSCANILNNSLYLVMFLHGGLEIAIASLAMQILLGCHHSYDEFQKGKYLEAFGHLGMAAIRSNQMLNQVHALQIKWKIEEFKHAIEKELSKKPSAPLSSLSPNSIDEDGQKNKPVVLHRRNLLSLPTPEETNIASKRELGNILLKYSNNSRGYSVLEEAVFQKDYYAIDLLLINGSPLNSSNLFGRSPVTIAVINDDEKMVDYLIRAGATFSSANLGFIASQDNAIERLTLLKNKGIDIKISQETLKNILPRASFELIELFLNNGTDVKGEAFKAVSTVYTARPPLGILYYAMPRGDINIIRLLIDHGAFLDTGAYSIQSLYNPLTMAIFSNRIDIAMLLLERGAYVPQVICIERSKHTDALIKYAFKHNLYDLTTLLLKKGYTRGSENISTYPEPTLLQQAVEQNNPQMVRALLEGGVNPNTRGRNNTFPLKQALIGKYQDIVEILLEFKASLDGI